VGTAIKSAAAKLAAKGFAKGNAPKANATAKSSKAPLATVNGKGKTPAFDIKLGAIVWSAWLKTTAWVALGIREKTATGLGTRSSMLATAAYGYPQGQGEFVAKSVAAYRASLGKRGTKADMECNPHKGGVDFPWLEKPSNLATITSSATVRLDARDKKMRLLAIVATRKPKAKSAEVEAVKQRKATGARSNGNVTVSRMTDAELAKLQAESDGAASS
jgi:hypothetical protein